MVMAQDSRLYPHHSASHLPNLNDTSTLLNHGQQNISPSPVNQTNEARGLFQCLSPRLGSFPSTYNPYVKEEPSAFCYGHGFKAAPNASFGSPQKRFVIFDRSGSHTRLFFSALHSPAQNPNIAPTKSLDACEDLHDEVKAAKIEQNFPDSVEEKSVENPINGEGSEMHEDTEEINALLYSDYGDDDDSEDDDEVTSTDRSPCAVKGSYKKREHMEEKTADVGNSESSKRQRLIDGGYKKSPLMDAVSSAELDLDHILSTEKSRKDKIRETLKILETLIPGEKSEKNPLMVIEEAISYLKYLKLKAKALGVR
ncbi:hypothetical protein U1Q18_004144 [Sarracenia purpurea var. burkii]